MDEQNFDRVRRDLEEDRRRNQEVRDQEEEARRSLSEPEELFRFLNTRLERAHQKPFPAERIQELTSPDARAERRAMREKAETALNAIQSLYDRKGEWNAPNGMGNLYRVIPAFLEPTDREGAKERNDAFLRSLETPEGQRELAVRAIELAEKTDESFFLEQDPDRILQNITEHPELAVLGFVFDKVEEYLKNQPDLDPRMAHAAHDRVLVWENAGRMQEIARCMADPLYELLGGLTMDETAGLSGINGGSSPLNSAKARLLTAFSNSNLNRMMEQVTPEEKIAAELLSGRNLLVGDVAFQDEAGKRLNHEAGLREIGRGKPVTMEWYPSVTSGEGMTCTVSVQNGQLQMSEGTRCTRAEITSLSYDGRTVNNRRAMAHIQDGTPVDAAGGPLTAEEATQRLLRQEEVVVVWKNGAAMRIVNRADDPDPANMALSETESTVEAEAERLLADREKTVQLVQNLRQHNGLPPLEEARVQALTADTERAQLHAEVAEMRTGLNEALAYRKKYDVPEAAGHLGRLAAAFLEPEDTPEAAERNRAYIASLETPQGRRELFLRALDTLEEGPGAFLETDIHSAVRNFPAQERLMTVGWAMSSTLINYANSDEGADLDPALLQRLQERKSICEECSEVQDELTLAADSVYPVMGGMTADEIVVLMGATGTRSPLEQAVSKRVMDASAQLLGEKERWQTRQTDPERKAVLELGRQLQENGLLKGDNVFRGENNERLDHLEALQKLARGEKLTLEHYDSRNAGEGAVYTLAAKDGAVMAEAARGCTREPFTVPAYDPNLAAVGKAMKQVKDFAAFQTKTGEELSWNEGLRQLAQGTELVIAGKDGALRKLSAEGREGETGVEFSLKETPATRARLEFEHAMTDGHRLLEAINGMLQRSNVEPFSEARIEELLAGEQQRRAQQEAAAQVKTIHDALENAIEGIELPTELGMMRRIARLFLKTPDQPNAEADNRDLVEGLQTPQGRRDLFYRVLDLVEEKGEAGFLETDPERMVELVREDPAFGKIGFVMDAMRTYLNTPEGLELQPEVGKRLDECKALCEEGANYQSVVNFRAHNAYPLLGAMNTEELEKLVSGFSGAHKSFVDDEITRELAAYVTDALKFAGEAEEPRQETLIGNELGEMGLLTGDITFRNEAGERMAHMDALRAVAGGQSVELAVYENRRADTGKVYTVSLEDGMVSARDSADCTREPVPDLPFSPRAFAVASELQELSRTGEVVWKNAEGRELEKKEAQTALLGGETLSMVRYESRYGYIGREESLRLQPDSKAQGGVKLETGKPTIITRSSDLSEAHRTAQANVQELKKIQQILKQSDPFYVSNSPQFKPMMNALDQVVRFHERRQGFGDETRQQMTELYNRLNEKVNEYLAVKTEKLKQRTDDSRGQLRFDVVSSLKTMLSERSVARLSNQLTRQTREAAQARQQPGRDAQAPQAGAPRRERGGGPQL